MELTGRTRSIVCLTRSQDGPAEELGVVPDSRLHCGSALSNAGQSCLQLSHRQQPCKSPLCNKTASLHLGISVIGSVNAGCTI